MWRWMKHWIDSVRHDLIPLSAARRGGFAVHVRYDTGGHTHQDLPIPWAADAVTVEVVLRLPPAARRKTDFLLRFPGFESVPADAVRPDNGDRARVTFRFPVPRGTACGEFLWKHRPLTPVVVPVLSADAFLETLSLTNPTVAVRLAGQTVPVRGFVPTGGRGLVATAIIRGSHRLAPVPELGLSVAFRREQTGDTFIVPIPLMAEQRSATESVVTAVCPRRPRRAGWWSVSWRVGPREMATRRVEVIPARRFADGVRAADARFAVAEKSGAVRVVRQPPAAGATDRIGPCFLVTGGEPGAAGVCRLAVFAVTPGEPQPAPLMEQDLLVTDAPTVFAPGLLGIADLGRIGGFELRLNGRVLGAASLSPVPPATLTSEGGFRPPPDFTWTAAAEEELLDRLGRLGNS